MAEMTYYVFEWYVTFYVPCAVIAVVYSQLNVLSSTLWSDCNLPEKFH